MSGDIFFKKLFIYLFLDVLGLSFCARAFSSCGERGPLFIAVRGPLTIAAPPVAGHRLQTRRLSNCGSRAQLLHGMWDLPGPGHEPVSPALAGRLSTTAPPGKPWRHFDGCPWCKFEKPWSREVLKNLNTRECFKDEIKNVSIKKLGPGSTWLTTVLYIVET